MDPANWLAPAGIAVLTATLLRKTRSRFRGRAQPAARSESTTAADTVRETVAGWELRLHDAGRAAEASLRTRAAELTALERSADAAADRLRLFAPNATPDELPATGDAAIRRHLRQAGYDDGQIDVLLGRGEEDVRRAA